ncbi:glycosyltransferase family 2 protein [Allocoleopsis sp.]|uniref:glycosyltransferase family 2 protein n=1 Tax=Allocoleopsis sp. TaxID=3088169 RepID=UPI002FD267F0
MSNDRKLYISIGILAYNESAVISTTLNSLLQQSLFSEPNPDMVIEIVVVPNGCKDDTAAISRATLAELIKPSLHTNVNWRVCEVEQAGLANAWNLYIHEFSDPQADYLFVMSADIQLLDPQTLRSMVQILETRPEAWVSVDKRIKDVSLKEKKSLMEQLSTLVSGLSGSKAVEGSAAWISGQLSCTRAKVLRRIWMPTTLPTDDAFLYTMIVTDFLKAPEEPNRVILASSASHVFEAYTDMNRLLRHEKWLIFGQAVNELLYADLLENSKEQQDITLLIKQRNERDPFWLNKLVQTAINEKGGWLIPNFILIRRFQSLFYKPIYKAILLFPLAFAAFILDAILAFQVNLELHSKGGVGYWLGSGGWGKSAQKSTQLVQ